MGSKLEALKKAFAEKKMNRVLTSDDIRAKSYEPYMDFVISNHSPDMIDGFNTLLELQFLFTDDVSEGLFNRPKYQKNENHGGVNSLELFKTKNGNGFKFLVRGEWEVQMLGAMLRDVADTLDNIHKFYN